MFRIRSLAFGLFAALIFISMAAAAPMRCQINMVAPVDAPAEFSGASIELLFTWNSDTLSLFADVHSVQTSSWSTYWRPTNVSAEMAITGSTGRDGTYKSSPMTEIWYIANHSLAFVPVGDAIYLPGPEFPVGGDTISIEYLVAVFADSYYQELSTLYPKPFSNHEASWTWESPTFTISNYSGPVTDVTGFAVYVPEPSTLTLGSFALLSVAAFRRRK